ncbi:MAG: hypothetical protein ACE5H9_08715 [Anaerolineae bacterium]
MIPPRVLICGANSPALQTIAQVLSEEGVKVRTTISIIDCLYCSDLEWDFLLVDLDRPTRNLLGLLPAIRCQFPDLQVIGVATQSTPDTRLLKNSLELDDYLFRFPRPEDINRLFSACNSLGGAS